MENGNEGRKVLFSGPEGERMRTRMMTKREEEDVEERRVVEDDT